MRNQVNDMTLKQFLTAIGLTFREAEICELVTKAMSSKGIGAALFITEKTVKFHLTQIYRKLGFKTNRRMELVRFCLAHLVHDELNVKLEEERALATKAQAEVAALRSELEIANLPVGEVR